MERLVDRVTREVERADAPEVVRALHERPDPLAPDHHLEVEPGKPSCRRRARDGDGERILFLDPLPDPAAHRDVGELRDGRRRENARDVALRRTEWKGEVQPSQRGQRRARDGIEHVVIGLMRAERREQGKVRRTEPAAKPGDLEMLQARERGPEPVGPCAHPLDDEGVERARRRLPERAKEAVRRVVVL